MQLEFRSSSGRPKIIVDGKLYEGGHKLVPCDVKGLELGIWEAWQRYRKIDVTKFSPAHRAAYDAALGKRAIPRYFFRSISGRTKEITIDERGRYFLLCGGFLGGDVDRPWDRMRQIMPGLLAGRHRIALEAQISFVARLERGEFGPIEQSQLSFNMGDG